MTTLQSIYLLSFTYLLSSFVAGQQSIFYVAKNGNDTKGCGQYKNNSCMFLLEFVD